MKKIMIAILALLSCTSYAATLSIPDDIELIAVNGKHVEVDIDIELPPGQHFIEVRYAELFDTMSDNSLWVRSSSMYLTLKLEDEGRYQLSTPNYHSYEEAESFKDNPKLFITSETGVKEEVKVMDMSNIISKLHSSILVE